MVAILLHFLFLSIFAWLLVEAIHVFRMMTNLCDINHGPMHCYFSIGFGKCMFLSNLVNQEKKILICNFPTYDEEYICGLEQEHTMNTLYFFYTLNTAFLNFEIK